MRIPEGDVDQGDVERVCFIFDLQQKHGRISIYLSVYLSIHLSINLYTYMNEYIIYIKSPNPTCSRDAVLIKDT